MNIDQLKKVIQAANPEITEFKFGCVIKTESGKIVTLGNEHLSEIDPIGGTSLGRTIRLTDVLNTAILQNSANRTRLMVEASGQFRDDVKHTLGPFWNLKDDNLDNQSEETKQFLVDLLVT